MGTWEHRAILEGNKGTRTPLGDPQGEKRYDIHNQFYNRLSMIACAYVCTCCTCKPAHNGKLPILPVPKFKKGLGTSVHIVKITSYQKNNPTTRNIS